MTDKPELTRRPAWPQSSSRPVVTPLQPSVAMAIRPESRMILVETVSNPTLRVADIAGIAALCRENGLLLAIDNTFPTPRAFRPFDHGADIVIHSVTKLLAGHSDAMLGYVAARDGVARTSV